MEQVANRGEGGRLNFSKRPSGTPEQAILSAEIESLDGRSHRRLGADTREREEVLNLLLNAANMSDVDERIDHARDYYDKAQQAYLMHVQSKNRILYLSGTALGFLAVVVIAGIAFAVNEAFANYIDPDLYVKPGLVVLIPLLAGIGSLTSVWSRLTAIDLKQDISGFMIILSGVARPVVAISLAFVVSMIIDAEIVAIQFGESPTEFQQAELLLIVAFLCGFSERFATDIISRVPLARR